jgi:predicted dithiol-disulfide oxidoreductase (DUF899 family)
MMEKPRIVSQEEWLEARTNLLVKEKQLTRQRDALAAERRRMPWLAVEIGRASCRERVYACV